MVIYMVAQYNKPRPVNWSPTLYYNDKIPFGTYIFYHQLNWLFPGSKVIKTNASIYNTVHDSTAMAGNYIIIAKTVNINKYDFGELVKYMKAGNSVFISCFKFNGFLADTLKLSPGFEQSNGNTRLSFTSNQLKQSNYFTFNTSLSNLYFNSFDTSRATVISKNNYGHSIYISFKFGKGTLYLCADPWILTNYSLLNNRRADYAAKALSYLPETQNVYWDEFQNGDIADDESPMRVFFSHPSLQWAYYLSLFGMIIFVLFEIKRRQRIIPVIEPLKNSTVDFVNVVGQVYYEKRNNANIAHKKILYLLEHLRGQYQLKTNKLDSEFVEKLRAKLGIDAPFVNELVNYIQFIGVQAYVSDRELIELNKLIENFYTQTS
jgi:hypothetical protein